MCRATRNPSFLNTELSDLWRRNRLYEYQCSDSPELSFFSFSHGAQSDPCRHQHHSCCWRFHHGEFVCCGPSSATAIPHKHQDICGLNLSFASSGWERVGCHQHRRSVTGAERESVEVTILDSDHCLKKKSISFRAASDFAKGTERQLLKHISALVEMEREPWTWDT